jgi:hypothetical protein
MKGDALLLSRVIAGGRVQFIIPVYQRNYSWLTENCNQLFNDLVDLVHSDRPTHFFGSIVTSPADGYGINRLVIDGQQRLTTISLLLLAGIHAVENGELEGDRGSIEEAKEEFLMAKFSGTERKIKLVPIENDLEAYDRIFQHDVDNYVKDSKMTRNYQYFYERLTKEPHQLSFDSLLSAIERLQIISIELDGNDQPQLIFESLNSTGLDLTGADEVRNYLLMSLIAEEQQYYFKTYWQKIEVATENEPTMFLRDYLTIKQQLQRPVRLANLYSSWKKYMLGHDRKEELAEMLVYAQYYHQVTEGELYSKKLSDKMRHICNIETDVANVFFIQFLKYADEKHLTEDEIFKVIDLVENYMARRIVCNMPGNALTQVFCALHKDVLKSMEEYEKAEVEINFAYSDILAYHIMRRDGNYQLPRDTQFVEAIENRDAYHMLKPFQIFLFERLENSVHGEYNDVASDMKSKDATIEHIMPQTLNAEWREMLGDNFEEIQERYLHTFANLTLTGINSELSNKAFEIKRDGRTVDNTVYPGYKDSKYRLTRSVTNCQKWTEEELQKRSKKICEDFLRLYPLPRTEFTPLPKPVEEVSLDEESFSPTNRMLRGFRVFGNEYNETIWKDMLVKVVSLLSERYPDVIDSLYDGGAYLWTSKQADLNYCTQIGADKYLWTSMGNKGKIACLRYLFDKCDVAESELVFVVEPSNE